MLIREVGGHLPCGLTDDLNEMNQREAKILVRVVRATRQAEGLAYGLIRHVEHVPDIDEVTRRHTVVRRYSAPDRECGR